FAVVHDVASRRADFIAGVFCGKLGLEPVGDAAGISAASPHSKSRVSVLLVSWVESICVKRLFVNLQHYKTRITKGDGEPHLSQHRNSAPSLNIWRLQQVNYLL